MNPINYALGLVAEVYHAQGNKERSDAVQEQLAWVSGELEKVSAESLTEEGASLFAEAKQAVANALVTKSKRTTK